MRGSTEPRRKLRNLRTAEGPHNAIPAPFEDPEYLQHPPSQTVTATATAATAAPNDPAKPSPIIPTKRKTPDNPDNPDDENPIIKHLRSLEERLGKRIGALEETRSTHSSRHSSRRSSRSSSKVSATVCGDGQAQHPTQNPAQQLPVGHMQTTPANVNEYTVMPNAVPVLPENDVLDRFAKLFHDEDQNTRKTVQLHKIAKHFPTAGRRIAALETWVGVKSAFSNKGIWAASVAVHIGQIPRLSAIYGWPNVRNYEIAFYSRYHMLE